MLDQPVYISKEGLEKLKAEVHELKTVTRREIIDRVEKAKDLGDLRENADYHDAKELLAYTEGRILEIEDSIKRAVIIEHRQTDAVAIGSTVHVSYDGKEKKFAIVGSTEADPLQGRISNESPTGRALLGKKVGEVAEVTVPAGTIRYTITAIE
jgi:transcription elongation factor GreA